jgi:hypothetical protein
MSDSLKLTGLFLGAGFSYEVGMPLVMELTRDLKETLTPAKVKAFNKSWREQGTGFSDAVIDDYLAVMSRTDMHYESVLGYLETEQRRSSSLRNEYHGIYAWFVECVSHILIRHHTLNTAYIELTLRYLDGFAQMAIGQKPFWVFSLNHDLVVECLATKHDIPVNSGFCSGEVALTMRGGTGEKTGYLRAESIKAEQFAKGMPFFPPGTPGINLLKIHGALDVFTYNETGEDVLKLLPLERSIAGVIGALRAANEELRNMGDGSVPYRTTNEITYADDDGQIQYLRRSILAGAYKFDQRVSQVLPRAIFKIFKTYINYVSTLVCIGYGFGDIHVNQVLRDWLEFSVERRLEIVNPGMDEVPQFLRHVAPQVVVINTPASDYFDKAAGIVRTESDLLEKQLGAWIRKQPDKQQADREFTAFLNEYNQQVGLAFLKTLASSQGDGVDSGSAAGSRGISDRVLNDTGCTRDACLKAFLDSRKSKT